MLDAAGGESIGGGDPFETEAIEAGAGTPCWSA